MPLWMMWEGECDFKCTVSNCKSEQTNLLEATKHDSVVYLLNNMMYVFSICVLLAGRKGLKKAAFRLARAIQSRSLTLTRPLLPISQDHAVV